MILSKQAVPRIFTRTWNVFLVFWTKTFQRPGSLMTRSRAQAASSPYSGACRTRNADLVVIAVVRALPCFLLWQVTRQSSPMALRKAAMNGRNWLGVPSGTAGAPAAAGLTVPTTSISLELRYEMSFSLHHLDSDCRLLINAGQGAAAGC